MAVELSFEEWLDNSFGRPVTDQEYPQFIPDVSSDSFVPDHLAVHYMTRLFEHPEASLRSYSDGQIAAGLWAFGPGDAHCVSNRNLIAEDRVRLIGSVEVFFREFFDKRCAPQLGHLVTGDDPHTPLNCICYMWWEAIIWHVAEDDPAAELVFDKDLDVMEAILRLENPACKESALHGLGHLAPDHSRAEDIIDRFLVDAAGLSPELARYARAARSGCIQ